MAESSSEEIAARYCKSHRALPNHNTEPAGTSALTRSSSRAPCTCRLQGARTPAGRYSTTSARASEAGWRSTRTRNWRFTEPSSSTLSPECTLNRLSAGEVKSNTRVEAGRQTKARHARWTADEARRCASCVNAAATSTNRIGPRTGARTGAKPSGTGIDMGPSAAIPSPEGASTPVASGSTALVAQGTSGRGAATAPAMGAPKPAASRSAREAEAAATAAGESTPGAAVSTV